VTSGVAAADAPPASTRPGRSTERRNPPIVYLAGLLILALSAAGLVLWFTSAGIGVTTDSAVYLGAADNLVNGRGLTTPFTGDTTRYSPAKQVTFGSQIPIVEYPPIYPLALSIPRAGGLANSGAARAINSLSLALLVLLIGVALWWLVQPPFLVVFVVEALAISGPTFGTVLGSLNPLGLAGFALSETLFLVLCFAALLAGAHAATTVRSRAVIVAACLAGLAMLTRYVGGSSGIAAAAAVLLGARTDRRARRVLPIAVAGPVAVVGWNALSGIVWGGGSARTIVWHPSSVLIHGAVNTMGAWFHLPPSWPYSLRTAVVVALVLLPSGLALAPPVQRWLRPHDPLDRGTALTVALGTFVLAYLVAVVVTEALLDAGSQPGQRLLVPVQIATYLLLTSLVVLAGDRLLKGALGGRRVAYVLVVVLAVAAAFQPLSRLRVSARALQHTASTARRRAGDDPLRALPRGVIVFTDDPGGLWLYSGRGSYRLPATIIETTGQTDHSYRDEVRQVVDIVEQRKGLVVIPPGGSAEYVRGSLRPVGRCPSGDVVLAIPGTPAAVAASSLCPSG
jgi:hypothetical protein